MGMTVAYMQLQMPPQKHMEGTKHHRFTYQE